MSVLNVLYQHDNNYAVFGGVSILSLFENNRDAEDICVYMIDMGLEQSSKDQYAEMARQYDRRVCFIPAEDIVRQVEGMGLPKYRGSYATYLKLFAAGMLPDTVGKIFYLDSDLLVEGSLSALMDFDMQGNAVAMARDGLSLAFKDIYGFAREEAYYCGGTILFDVAAWKQQRCLERITAYARDVRGAFFAADQDLLNIVLKNQITKLDLKYDFTYIHTIYPDRLFVKRYGEKAYYSAAEIEAARQNTAVLHFMRFLGESPWNSNTLHPHKERFDHYLALSPWKDYERQEPRNDLVFRLERILYRVVPRSWFFSIFMAYYRHYVIKADRKLCTAPAQDIVF